MKKKSLWIVGIAILIIVIGLFMIFRIGSEDSWIKDSRGIYIKHGVPSNTPSYVLEQQEAINCALNKFENFNEETNSQCLGVCGNYAVDVVHVPRSEEDNKAENQCEAYRNGEVSNFIELDKEGNIVRII